MKVPFGNLARDEQQVKIGGTTIESAIRENIGHVMEKRDFVLGDYVKQFENAFAAYCGAKHCIGVSSGLSALELSLVAAGICTGDEVITVANTFNATVGAIVKTGAKPVLVDADSRTFNIDINQIPEKITEKTRAIVPVHLYGQTVEMDKIRALAQKYKLAVIEDACQAHGAKFNSQRAGSFGIAGCFSFYPGKNLGGYGDGGAIITSDDSVAEFLRKTRNYGQTMKYHHDVRADNSRLDTIQAAALIPKLIALNAWNFMRIENAEYYREYLSDVEQVRLPLERKHGEHIYHLYVIRAKDRDELAKHLDQKGVQTGMHYPVPIHLQKCFAASAYKEGDFPMSENLSKEILSLPMFPTLHKEEIKYVADSIKEFYK